MSLKLTFYGDDFTGSTDAMEVLSLAGIRTALFLEPPTSDQLNQFTNLQALGVAGLSRSMSPAEMDVELPPIFEKLKTLGAPLVHYKVCSTFDSSPEVGSIGRALDLGQKVMSGPFTPLVVGAPPLGRYVVFGNLFARAGQDGAIFRLDQHPTMSTHPITPMDESDLGRHLSRQTSRKTKLFDFLQMEGNEQEVDERFAELLRSNPEVVLFDAFESHHLPLIGRLIWEEAKRRGPLFAIGSSGVEYALTAHWSQAGLATGTSEFCRPGAAQKMVVISGSCSPVTARQLQKAKEQGFADIPLETPRLFDPKESNQERDRAATQALRHLAEGRSVMLHSGLGPQDPRIEESAQRLRSLGYDDQAQRRTSARTLGKELGKLLRTILEESNVRRTAVAGGDISGHVARELSLQALEVLVPIHPGAPLCKAHAPGSSLDGLEVLFKGGQLGREDIFEKVLLGKP